MDVNSLSAAAGAGDGDLVTLSYMKEPKELKVTKEAVSKAYNEILSLNANIKELEEQAKAINIRGWLDSPVIVHGNKFAAVSTGLKAILSKLKGENLLPFMGVASPDVFTEVNNLTTDLTIRLIKYLKVNEAEVSRDIGCNGQMARVEKIIEVVKQLRVQALLLNPMFKGIQGIVQEFLVAANTMKEEESTYININGLAARKF